ncbi:MAG: hypothetical protein ACTTJ1_06920 [Treponema sp.]
MYNFFGDFFKILFVAIPLGILGIWKLVEIVVFIFQHISITMN